MAAGETISTPLTSPEAGVPQALAGSGQPVYRFAPSPNGHLHLGHAYSALTIEALARKSGGRMLLRIEDIDRTRCLPALERDMIEDLDWLGIRFEQPFLRQSDHLAVYAAALASLRAKGLIYPAFLTRGGLRQQIAAAERDGTVWPRDPDGTPLYPTGERALDPDIAAARIAAGERHAFRLDMDKALALAATELAFTELSSGTPVRTGADPSLWGDVVLSRSDAPSSYHLSVVVDDARQGVTHVVRGRDLFAATSLHRLLQHLLGLPEPLYHHHDLVRDDEGRKLSKSAGSRSLRDERAEGVSAQEIRLRLGF